MCALPLNQVPSPAVMPDKALMIDIETLDTAITAAVIAIGAVVFNPRGEGFDEGEISL